MCMMTGNRPGARGACDVWQEARACEMAGGHVVHGATESLHLAMWT